jgi:methylthioribose-1-phosphate isomerase
MEDEPMPRFTRRELLAAAPAVGVAAALAASTEARADQPHMEAALDALKAARTQLDAAAPDKGGHRGAALRLVKQAIAEVERGIGFARRH